MLRRVVDKEQTMILKAAIPHTFKRQRCLNNRISKHTCCTIKSLAILMQSFQEKESMVKTRQGKARQRLLHIRMEIPTIFLLQSLCLY